MSVWFWQIIMIQQCTNQEELELVVKAILDGLKEDLDLWNKDQQAGLYSNSKKARMNVNSFQYHEYLRVSHFFMLNSIYPIWKHCSNLIFWVDTAWRTRLHCSGIPQLHWKVWWMKVINSRDVGTMVAKRQLPYQYFRIVVLKIPFCPTNIPGI